MVWQLAHSHRLRLAPSSSQRVHSPNERSFLNSCGFVVAGFSWSSRNTCHCHGHSHHNVRGQEVDFILDHVLRRYRMLMHHIHRRATKRSMAENHIFNVGWVLLVNKSKLHRFQPNFHFIQENSQSALETRSCLSTQPNYIQLPFGMPVLALVTLLLELHSLLFHTYLFWYV